MNKVRDGKISRAAPDWNTWAVLFFLLLQRVGTGRVWYLPPGSEVLELERSSVTFETLISKAILIC